MSHSDIGHHCTVRLCYLGNLCHLSGFAHAKFNNADLRFLWYIKNSDGDTHLAVAVSRRLINPITGAQGTGYHLTGGRLSHTARNPYQRNLRLAAAPGSQRLKSRFCILYTDPGA